MKKIISVLVILLLALTIAGCKEESESGPAAGRGAPAGEEGGEELEQGSAEADVEEASEGDDWADKFTSLITKKAASEFTVSYDLTSKYDGETQRYSMTQYFGGPKRFRVDTKFPEGEARVFFVDNKMVSCNKQGGAWQCFEFTTEGQEQQDPTAQFRSVEERPQDYSILYAGTMSVAGATAYCYKIDYRAHGMPNSELKYCFSKEGVPLYMLVKAEGSETEMKATTYKASVSSSDFTPPAKAQDMNALMQQYQQQMPEGYEMPDY
ncbi:hypothetical protein KY359_00135 [Candidatus Woesearchaeota archaeon]|nr:hypothetical protein [Candidatus Woesearchaeota archaeon]